MYNGFFRRNFYYGTALMVSRDASSAMTENIFRPRMAPLNAIVNILRTLVVALIGVLLVPYYLDTLGLAAYGIIPLATTMTAYVMIISDSLGSACSRYATLAIDRGEDANKAISTGFFGIVKLSLILLPFMLAISFLAPYVFSMPENMWTEVQEMFLLIMVSSLIVTVSSALMCVFNAYNTLYELYIARIVYTVVQVAIIVVMFTVYEPSLVDIGIAYLLSSVVLLVMTYALAKHRHSEMRIRLSDYDKALFKKMGTLGEWTVFIKIGNMLYIQASLVIVNIYVGSNAGGEFAIISSLISMIHTACYSVTTSIAPYVYHFYAEEDKTHLIDMFKITLKFISLLFAMPVAFVMIFAPEIMTAWVGGTYDYLGELVFIALICDVAFCASVVLAEVPTVYLKVKSQVKYTLFFGIANIVAGVAVALFTDYGVKGVTTVWMISTLAYVIACVLFCERVTGVRPLTYLKRIGFGYVAMAACLIVLYFVSEYVDVPGRWIPLLILFGIMFMLYVPLMLKTFKSHERQMISRVLPSFMSRALARFLK